MPAVVKKAPRRFLLLMAMCLLSGVALYRSVVADTAQGVIEPEDPRYSKKYPLPDKHNKKDPIKANGEIFVETREGKKAPWPKPDVTMVFTGAQDGYLEPCGCAGLTNQKGGLKRRHTFLKQLAEKGWNPVALDSGGQVKRFGKQADIKLTSTLESLVRLGYRGVGFGTKDLRQDMLGALINLDPDANPMTSANVAFFDFDDDAFSQRYRVVEAGGFKIGFTSVLGKKEIAALGKKDDLEFMDPEQALKQVVPKLIDEHCDQHVLMVHGDADEAVALAKQFPAFHWVVAGLGADVPSIEPQKIEGAKAMLLEVGHKGMFAVAVGLYKQGDTRWRYEDVPMDHRFEDSPEMHQMLVEYQNQLRAMSFDGLNIKAMQHARNQEFAGSDACADCHTEAWEIFEKTPHSHALKTIVELDPPRHYDPECLSCHVTGWNPQKYVPYNSGFVSQQATPHLFDNGCENCHGPAAKHVAAENGDIDLTDKEIDALRKELHMELVENEGNKEGQVLSDVVNNCLECHDLDNSPDFDFQLYWPWVEHFGKD